MLRALGCLSLAVALLSAARCATSPRKVDDKIKVDNRTDVDGGKTDVDGGSGQREEGAAATCGDGVLAPSEACESGQLRGSSCGSMGFDGGQLRCTKCRLDASGCWRRSRRRHRGGRGSCPYVYLWDGSRYAYYTDLSGSVLGKGIPFFKSEFYGENIYELGAFAPRSGVYRMRLREVIFESSFVDELALLVVDLPAGYQVYNRWSFTSQLGRKPSLQFMTVKGARPPRTAKGVDGNDVKAAVSRADGVGLPVKPHQLSRVVVDFGPIARPEHAKLVITAWGYYGDLRAKQRPPYSAGTTIETLDGETRDGRGRWKVRRVAGKAAGDARSWVIDIAGIPTRTDTRMRITMAHLPSVLDVLDAVRLDDSAPVPITVTRVRPRIARLGFGGAARVDGSTLTRRIHADDSHLPAIPEAMLSGRYTRYGDVRPLLRRADDRFVVMAHGDEMLLEFDAPPRPAKKARRGTRRVAFLSADVFYTLKYHPFAHLTDTADPLPYHGMKTYPYAAGSWPYKDDAAYRRYLSRWNTRRIDPPTK